MSAQLLIISSQSDFQDEISALIGELNYTIRFVEALEKLHAADKSYEPELILYEARDENEKHTTETVDLIALKYPSSKIMIFCSKDSQIDARKLYEANVFRVIYRPQENEQILTTILEAVPVEIPEHLITLKCLHPVRIADFNADQKFDFDLFMFMPANDKILLYRRKNSDLTSTQISHLRKYNVNTLYIRHTDIPLFRNYTARNMVGIYKDQFLTETEKVEQLQKTVRELMGGLFDSSTYDFNRGRAVLEDCKNVVAQFILDVTPNPEVYQQILALSARNFTNYNHSVNVSVYGALFALALGHKDVEAIAIAGLLHDIGLSQLPEAITNVPFSNLTEDEQFIYKSHVMAALELLEKKKVPAAKQVLIIIEQHHENMDGSGYPKGLTSEEIHPLSKLVAIADEFDEMTSLSPGKELYTPLEAMMSLSETPQRLDKDILKKIFCFLALPGDQQSYDKSIVETVREKPVAVGSGSESDLDKPVRHARAPGLPQKESSSNLNATAPSVADDGFPLSDDEAELEAMLDAIEEKDAA